MLDEYSKSIDYAQSNSSDSMFLCYNNLSYFNRDDKILLIEPYNLLDVIFKPAPAH